MQRIFLIGYMGAGKTTLGRALAKVMGLQFIDLDIFIEGRQHKSVSRIFADSGEDGFRRLERQALEEVSQYEDVVIALGGGTPCFFDNMELVNAAGPSIWLKPSEDVLLRRLVTGKAKRPILAGKSNDELLDFIRGQMELRAPFYSRATFTLSGDNLETVSGIAETAQTIQNLLQTNI